MQPIQVLVLIAALAVTGSAGISGGVDIYITGDVTLIQCSDQDKFEGPFLEKGFAGGGDCSKIDAKSDVTLQSCKASCLELERCTGITHIPSWDNRCDQWVCRPGTTRPQDNFKFGQSYIRKSESALNRRLEASPYDDRERDYSRRTEMNKRLEAPPDDDRDVVYYKISSASSEFSGRRGSGSDYSRRLEASPYDDRDVVYSRISESDYNRRYEAAPRDRDFEYSRRSESDYNRRYEAAPHDRPIGYSSRSEMKYPDGYKVSSVSSEFSHRRP